MEQLDLWLKTYRVENRVSPASWSELPDDLKLNLENLARDEAVRRADEFARDGLLDLSLHDAVRQLVNAMAQAWTLPSGKVCEIVTDYIDQIPPDPGMEFDKLADIIFRRRTSATWAEISAAINTDNLNEVVTATFESIAIPEQSTLDRRQFLKLLNEAYDSWCMEHPKDAVKEVFKLLGSGDKREKLSLETVKELIAKRGAEMWCSALDLELEVGVEKAGKEELSRIMKRYALIRKRQGGGAVPVAEKLSAGVDTADDPREIPFNDGVVEDDAPTEDESGTSAAAVSDELIAPEEPGEVEFGSGVEPLGEMEESSDDTEALESEPETLFTDESELVTQVGDEDLTDSDEEAIRELFGDSDLVDETGEREHGEGETAPADKISVEPEEQADDSGEVNGSVSGTEKQRDEETVEEVDFDEMFAGGNDLEPTEDESERPPEDDSLIRPDEHLRSGDDESDGDTIKSASEDDLSGFNSTSASEDDEEPGEEAITDHFSIEEDDLADPLGRLRSGEFRERLIEELYNGNTDSFESFVARLENAPDWNRVKQFFANELFRLKVDMDSEIADELFILLKHGFGGKG